MLLYCLFGLLFCKTHLLQTQTVHVCITYGAGIAERLCVGLAIISLCSNHYVAGFEPRLMPLSKALYHTCFICGQRCKWWSRRPKLTSSVISDVKPMLHFFFLHAVMGWAATSFSVLWIGLGWLFQCNCITNTLVLWWNKYRDSQYKANKFSWIHPILIPIWWLKECRAIYFTPPPQFC